jgi:hypothetical protein
VLGPVSSAAELHLSNEPKLPVQNGTPASPPQPQQSDTGTALLDSPSSTLSPRPSATQLWLHRTSVFLFVLISAVAGVLLVILPWTPNWTDNSLLLQYPILHSILTSGFFRGICSGLGLLDIWIGFWEALHYHDR